MTTQLCMWLRHWLLRGASLSPSPPAIFQQKSKSPFLFYPSSSAMAPLLPVVVGHKQSTTKQGVEKTSPTCTKHTKKHDRQLLLPISQNHRIPDHAIVKRRRIHSHHKVAGEGRILSIFAAPSLQTYIVCGEPLSSYFRGFSIDRKSTRLNSSHRL